MAVYLKKFETHNEYESYINGSPILPNVSKCVGDAHIHYNPYNPGPPTPFEGFCRLTLKDGSTVVIEGEGTLSNSHVSDYENTCVKMEIGPLCNVVGMTGHYDYNSSFTAVTSVTIADTVTKIETYSFTGFNAMTEIEIGSGINWIDSGSFFNCTSLNKIVIKASTCPTIMDYETFENVPEGGTLYVPTGSDYSGLLGLLNNWTISYI